MFRQLMYVPATRDMPALPTLEQSAWRIEIRLENV